MSNWNTKPLGELLELVIDHRGKTPKKMGFDGFHDTGYPVLSAKHVKTDGLANIDGLRFSNEKMYQKWMKVEVQEGDIILTSEAPMGEVFYIDGKTKYVLGQRVFGLRPKKDLIDPLYLLAWLTSKNGQEQLVARSSGSTVLGIKQSELLKIDVDVPPKDFQLVIAKNRYDLSEKIELNRQTNQTLEHIAQAIYKSWFVDFEPTRAKIAAKQKGQDPERAAMAAISGLSITLDNEKAAGAVKSLEQLSPQQLKATAALFPDALVDSELGEIPKGWEVKSLSEIIEVVGGGTPKRSEELYWNGDIPWFSMKDAPSLSDVFVIDTVEKITELGLQKSSTKLLPVGTTIITARGTVGKLALVGTPMCMNQSCYGVIGVEGVGAYFNYFNLREAISTLQRNTHGAVFDTITTQTFESYSMSICAGELISKYEEFVTPMMHKIKMNRREINTLSTMRDVLLPKLLSGELNVNVNKMELEKTA